MKEGKLFFWCRIEGTEVIPDATSASDRMRVISEPNVERLSWPFLK